MYRVKTVQYFVQICVQVCTILYRSVYRVKSVQRVYRLNSVQRHNVFEMVSLRWNRDKTKLFIISQRTPFNKPLHSLGTGTLCKDQPVRRTNPCVEASTKAEQMSLISESASEPCTTNSSRTSFVSSVHCRDSRTWISNTNSSLVADAAVYK